MSSTRMLKGSCLCECDEVISVHPEVFFCQIYFFAFLFCFARWLLQTCVQVHCTSEYGVREEMHIVGLTDCGCTIDKDITSHW
jgi:hypothetical protein